MRIVIDALGAPRHSGGMRLFTQELIHAWADQFKQDRITVVSGEWVAEEFGSLPSIDTVSVRNESLAARVLGQFALLPLICAQKRADLLLSTSPIVSPLMRKSRRMCVVHDWRHLKRKNEFGLLQRSYRKLWQVSVHRAAVAIAVSEKTAEETRLIAPNSNVVLVESGRDHARKWQRVQRQTGQPLIVTFGHHSNKRPELVIRALGMLPKAVLRDAQLVVLGARGDYANVLEVTAKEVGAKEHCKILGFVSDHEYQSLIQRSSVVVMASSDEGFGLPVTEAQYFGIPVVCTRDGGLERIHGPGLLVADPDPESISKCILEGLEKVNTDLKAERPRKTWADVAKEIRSAIPVTVA